jgi:membrane-associated protein
MGALRQLYDLAWWLVDFILHFDRHLTDFFNAYGAWTYALLFAIIFCETGLVIFPILPGDSLLFAVGAFTAEGKGLDYLTCLLLLSFAAVLGDTVNYTIGHRIGPAIFTKEGAQRGFARLLNRKHLDRTHAFYERHGGKTLVISRFLPLFRTFAPFVAGIGAMSYARFTLFNLIGALGWVISLCLAGYWLGNLPWVRANLSLIIVGIIAFTLVPVAVGWLKHRAA